MHHVSVSAYKQAEAERRSDPICQKVGGGGICKRPGRGVAMVQYTITTRVDGDVLKVFWSYVLKLAFIKVPRKNKRCLWVRGFLLAYIPIQFLECLVCVGLRGNVNSHDMIAVNSSVARMVDTEAYEIPDQGAEGLIECRFLSSHHEC